MEFRRITNLPPYVFTIIDQLKVAGRRAGDDIIDLGFGNPDLPSPDLTVAKAKCARPSLEPMVTIVFLSASRSTSKRRLYQ